MPDEIFDHAREILKKSMEIDSPLDIAGIILFVIPLGCFARVLSYFSGKEKKELVNALKRNETRSFLEITLVVSQFIKNNHLNLETEESSPEIMLRKFAGFAGKNPDVIGKSLRNLI
ncbi:MAG: hypothetical protein ACLFQV_05565 [Vulcanimicrobiota bacterium]